jgi:hypothetical protein
MLCFMSRTMSRQPVMRGILVLFPLGLGLLATNLAGQEKNQPNGQEKSQANGQKPGQGTVDQVSAPPVAAESTAKPDRRFIENLQREIDMLGERRNELRETQRRLRDKIVAESGLSPENVKPVMLELERNLFTFKLESETKRYHVRLLTEMVAKITAQATDRAKSDRVVEGLDKIVEARKKVLLDLRAAAASGAAPLAEAVKAEAEVVDAETRLALRREEIANPAVGGDLERLNRELRELSIGTALDEVRLKELELTLKKLRSVLNAVDEYNDFTSRIVGVEQQIDRVQAYLLPYHFGRPLQ